MHPRLLAASATPAEQSRQRSPSVGTAGCAAAHQNEAGVGVGKGSHLGASLQGQCTAVAWFEAVVEFGAVVGLGAAVHQMRRSCPAGRPMGVVNLAHPSVRPS
eukprot:358943-Chlamydomonas_euryale.AAC.3